jgi:hypothetical protein
MRLSINQPAYLPWLGYFNRIAISDMHVVLDQVQFEKNSAVNRNKIRTANGWNWLTVPVRTKGKFGELAINSVEIDNTSNWADKHWKAICHSYGKSPYFGRYAPYLEQLYQRPWTRLVDLMDAINHYFIDEVLALATLEVRLGHERGRQEKRPGAQYLSRTGCHRLSLGAVRTGLSGA